MGHRLASKNVVERIERQEPMKHMQKEKVKMNEASQHMLQKMTKYFMG